MLRSRRGLSVSRLLLGLVVLVGVLVPVQGVVAPTAAAAGPTVVPGGSVTSAETWSKSGSPFVVSGRVRVDEGGSITIEPGVVVKFQTGSFDNRILVYGGQLMAVGTASEPIVFTSIRDDSVGGDTNGDGSATLPARDDWSGVSVSPPSRDVALRAPMSVVRNAVFGYGGMHSGGACNSYAELSASSMGRLAVSNSEFWYSGSAGVNFAAFDEGVGFGSLSASRFAESGCGGNFTGGDVTGNVFEDTIDSQAVWSLYGKGLKFYGNWLYKPAYVAPAVTREDADLRDNALLAGVLDQPAGQDPLDLAHNWWGYQLPATPEGCYDGSISYLPAVSYAYISGSGCANDGKLSITGYFTNVLPALDAPPAAPQVGVGGAWSPAGVPDGQTFGGPESGSEYGYRPTGGQADPVNSATGAFTTSALDATVAAGRGSLAASRSYTSADSAEGWLGPGWSFGYQLSLEVDTGRAVFRAGDGQRVGFTEQPDGSWLPDPGVTADLTTTQTGYTLTTRAGVDHIFDSSGRLTRLTDRNGEDLQFSYASSGRLETVELGGRQLSFGWSNDGSRLLRVTLPDGRYVEYGYTAGLLTSVRDLGEQTTSHDYDQAGRLTQITSPEGRTLTKLAYDAGTGRVSDQWDGRNNHTTFSFDQVSGTSTMTDPRGGQWKDVYSDNVLLKRIDASGGVTSFEYDADLRLVAATSPTGQLSTLGYTANGDLASFQGPTKAVVTAYNAHHQPTTTINARGIEGSLGYDSSGNLTSVSRRNPDGGDPLVTSYAHNSRGQVTTITDANNHTATNTYNSHGDLTSATTPEGATTSYSYDTAGRLTKVVAPAGNEPGANPDDWDTVYTYNDNDQVSQVEDPLGRTTSYTYDHDGLLTTSTDPKGRTATYSYDADGHLLTEQGPDPDIDPASYTWDANANLTQITDPAGRTTSYTYTAANRIATVSTPIGTYQLGYTKTGQLASVKDPSNATTTILYDLAGRVSKLDYPGSTADVTIGYNANGARSKMVDPTGTTTYTYDPLDQLTKVTRGTTVWNMGYDPTGNLTNLTYPDGTSYNYRYDNDNRLTKTLRGTEQLSHYTYDPNNNLTSAERGDGTTTSRTFDPAGRVTRIADTTSTNQTLLDETYTYDQTDNPVAISHADNTTDHYTYDQLDRLTRACWQADCDTATDYIGWTHDPAGNILTETRPTTTTNHTYNTKGQLTARTPTGGPTTNYTYNTLGQRLTAGNTSYTYDVTGRTKTITSNGQTTTYTYDGDGQRLTDTTAGTTTNWQYSPVSGDLAAELAGTNLVRRYAYGALGRETLTTPTGDYYYHADRQGSLLNLTDNTGTSLATHQWEPYGQTKASQQAPSAPTNPMRWAGQYTTNTGTNLAGNRAYDPASGTFTQPDPASAVAYSASYTYAAANPMVYTDHTGNEPDWRAVAQTTHDIMSGVSAVAGTAALILAATGIGAPAAAFLGGVALGASIVTAGTAAYLAWDTCNQGKPSCGNAILQAGIDTATAIPMASWAKTIGRQATTRMAANGAEDAVSITTRYSRPSGATTRAQREAVQGQPCVECGNIAERQVADHIDPLVKEYYRTGTIDLQRMRSLEAVQPQCPTCSARQGALMSRYSIEMRRLLGLE